MTKLKSGETDLMSKEEFLNYIIDFAMDAEWGDLKRRCC